MLLGELNTVSVLVGVLASTGTILWRMGQWNQRTQDNIRRVAELEEEVVRRPELEMIQAAHTEALATVARSIDERFKGLEGQIREVQRTLMGRTAAPGGG